MFQDGLTIDLELRLSGFQAFDALVQFGKQFLNLGDDAALFHQRGHGKRKVTNIFAAYVLDPHPFGLF